MARYDYNIDWRSMSERNRREIMNTWSRIANRRLRRLRESGIDIFDGGYEIGNYLTQIGRRTVPGARTRGLSQFQVDTTLAILQDFLRNDNSTLSGIRRITEEVYQRTADRLRSEGIEVEEIFISNPSEFYQFLHSSLFKDLKQYFDSHELVKDFAGVFSRISLDDLREKIQQWNVSQMGYNEVQERLRNMTNGRIEV